MASLDSDCQMLNDSFEGLLQCAQARPSALLLLPARGR
jgi:hypothetical protein